MVDTQQHATDSTIQDVFTTLRTLEATSYKTRDYLQEAWGSLTPTDEDRENASEIAPLTVLSDSELAATAASYPASSGQKIVLQQWRLVMAEWIFVLVDYFEYPREAAVVSMNYLDRCMSALMSSGSSPPSKQEFQRICATCAYVGLKVTCSPRACLSAAQISLLCRGLFTEEQIIASELDILERLQWRLHPPIGHTFLECYAKLIQTGNDLEGPRVCWELIDEEARYLVELALLDSKLAMQRPSLIAMAALLNALSNSELSNSQLAVVSAKLGSLPLMGDEHTQDLPFIRSCQLRLQFLQTEQDEANSGGMEEMRVEATFSPSSVTQVFQL